MTSPQKILSKIIISLVLLAIVFFAFLNTKITQPDVEKKRDTIESAVPKASRFVAPANLINDAESSTPEVRNIVIGGNAYELFFQEGNMPSAVKRAIIDDIEMSYKHFHEVIEYDLQQHITYEMPDGILTAKKRITTTGKGRRFPDILNNEFGPIVMQHGKPYVVISSALSESYVDSLKLIDSSSQVYRGLADLIARINESSAEKPLKDKPANIIWVPESDRGFLENPEMAKNLLLQISGRKIRKPSILEYKSVSGDYAESGINYRTKSYIIDVNETPIADMNLIHHSGRWKIALGTPGT